MMRSVLERVGDQILQSVLPKRTAAACGWTGYVQVWSTDGGNITKWQSTNTCTGATRCKVDSFGDWYALACN